MSAFNTVKTIAICPICQRHGEWDVQFKYGDVWQYAYGIGDQLRWGGNDEGELGHKRVVVLGADICPKCDELIDFEVWLERDKIAKVSVASGEYKLVGLVKGYYIVVEK